METTGLGQTAEMDEVSRVSEMTDFHFYLKIKAVEGNLRASEGVKWTDLVVVGYGPDQTSGWKGSTEIHAVRTPRMKPHTLQVWPQQASCR